MAKEFDFIQTMLEQQGQRIETLAHAVGEVGAHCATLVERSAHLATREDVSTAIATHTAACRVSRLPRKNGNMGRLIKALAAFLAVAAAAISAYFGFATP